MQGVSWRPYTRPLYALSPRAVAAARPCHCCAQSLPGRLRMADKAAAQDDLPREEDRGLRSEGPDDKGCMPFLHPKN